MPASSAKDFANQINTNKTKSSATVNKDGTVTANVTYSAASPANAAATHSRMIIDAGSQTVTIGDGSGVKVCNIDQYLNSLQ